MAVASERARWLGCRIVAANLRKRRGVACLLPGLLALACATLGCGDEPPPEQSATVEIFSWWSSESETNALDAVLQEHRKLNPDVRVINAAEELAEDARARLADRMRRGLPPDTFQANIGRDLFQWVQFGSRDDSESKVASLNELAEEHDWFNVFPQPVIDALSYRGTMYGVPLNIHRLNTMLYNKRVFAEQGLEVPETLEQLHTVLDQLVERGYTAPLSIGNRYNWTMSLLLMENLFPAVAGADFYRSYWRGEQQPEHDNMGNAVQELLRLWPYFNDDSMDIIWTQGVERLFADGKERQAAMTVMGDWAKGHLEAEGFVGGEDFGIVPFPGSQETFVFTSDCFPLPKGAPHREQVRQLLGTFGSRAGQLAFNAKKGSLPARLDIRADEDLDPLARVTWDDFRSAELVLALSGLLDGDFAEALAVAVRETLLDQDPDPVLFALRNNL
jgi:glucose/mannose transport system substrate-binding protein